MKKTTYMTLTILLAVCCQTRANFSGGDDFNDNTIDNGKWSVTTSPSTFNETGGRLEFSGNPVSDAEASWMLNSGSYTQDWSIVCDAYNSLGIAGMYVSFGTNDSYVNVEHYRRFDITNEHLAFSSFGIDGDETFEFSDPITNDMVKLSLAFDSDSKTIFGSFDKGNGFELIANFDVSMVGMDDDDVFSLGFYAAGTTSGVAGIEYFDNVALLTYMGVPPQNENARIHCSSLIGSWVRGDPTTKDSIMLTFLTNGTFFLMHDGIADSAGQAGMERGIYSWNESTGAFAHSITVDTCGEWGFSHATVLGADVQGDTVYFDFDDEGTGVFHRVNYPASPPSIVGGWHNLDTSVTNHENVVLTFLPNGIYFFAQDGNTVYDPNGEDGMERGTYSWNSSAGTYSATVLTDTCGEWGPNGTGIPVILAGNTMQITGANFAFKRVVDPQCSDIDGDGLPDVWELQYFGNPTNTPANADGDGDELDDRSEFVAGTNPTNGASVFEVSDTGSSPSGFVLSWPAVEGRAYTVEWTDHLTNSFSVLTNGITYPQNSYTDTVHTAESGGFYNLKVKLEN